LDQRLWVDEFTLVRGMMARDEAENLVLRRQLGLFKERGIKSRRIDAATRVSLT